MIRCGNCSDTTTTTTSTNNSHRNNNNDNHNLLSPILHANTGKATAALRCSASDSNNFLHWKQCIHASKLSLVQGREISSIPFAHHQKRWASGPPGSWDKFYKCSECGKTFRLQNALNHHLQTKHGGSGSVIIVDKHGKEITGESAQTGTATSSSASKNVGTKAATTGSSNSSTAEGDDSTTSIDGGGGGSAGTDNLFVCTVCQKGFRVERALHHHYMAKHNMTPPGASASASKGLPGMDNSGGSASAGSDGASTGSDSHVVTGGNSSDGGNNDNSLASLASDATVPQPPQYHLDVAPNAPDEYDIAAHSRCVNTTLLIGQAQDAQRGFVFEDPVLQFVVATDFADAAPGDPTVDFHTVRVFGEHLCNEVEKTLVNSGLCVVGGKMPPPPKTSDALPSNGIARVLVSGRLRMVPQYEPTTSKYYHFPIIHVHNASGHINAI